MEEESNMKKKENKEFKSISELIGAFFPKDQNTIKNLALPEIGVKLSEDSLENIRLKISKL